MGASPPGLGMVWTLFAAEEDLMERVFDRESFQTRESSFRRKPFGQFLADRGAKAFSVLSK